MSTLYSILFFPTAFENKLLIGFRYLQNDLFNGITRAIMILFEKEAIKAFGGGFIVSYQFFGS